MSLAALIKASQTELTPDQHKQLYEAARKGQPSWIKKWLSECAGEFLARTF